MYKNQSDASKAELILKFFDWCYKHGAQIAKDLHYIPIPQSVYSIAETRWASDITIGGAPVWKNE
jgi:phosphate transport system substrate-binding protein